MMIISNLNRRIFGFGDGTWLFKPAENERFAGSIFMGHSNVRGTLMVVPLGDNYVVNYWYRNIKDVLYEEKYDELIRVDRFEVRKKLPKNDGEARLGFQELVEFTASAIAEFESLPSFKW